MLRPRMHTVADGKPIVDPLLGRTLAGRYTIVRHIAKGGMGVVYEAVQQPLGRTVALKVIRAEAAADPEMQRRFEREAKAAAHLHHPNIVTVFDYGRTDDGALFLAMELVVGETLRDVLNAKGTLPVGKSVRVVESVLAALERAHEAGLVHRDLKPENIMLPSSTAGSVTAKVLDFGLAKPHDPDVLLGIDHHITQHGGFIGTPGYAAPEQAQGEPEHPRQDLYALGVVWWEMLTGTHPFTAPTPMKMVAMQMVADPPPLPPIAGLSASMATLLRTLVQRDPQQRPASAHDALQRLHAAVRDTTPAAVAAAAQVTPDAVTVVGIQRRVSPDQAVTLASPVPGTVPGAVAGQVGVEQATAFISEVQSPSRRMGRVVVGAAAAGLVGAVVAVMAPGWLGDPDKSNQTETTDAGLWHLAAPIDAGPVFINVELRGIPRYIAVRQLAGQIEGATVALYKPDSSLLLVEGATAPALAERLQGVPLQTPTPLVLEVVEVVGNQVVLRAVPPEESSALADAGPGALDAGPVDAILAPGGLSP